MGKALGSVLGIVVLSVALLALATTALAPQSGALALGAILLPHLSLVALALVPIATLLRHRFLGASLAILALVTIARFGPEWVSLPRGADGRDVLTVATWNVLAGGTSAQEVVERLLASDAEIVALQELTPDVADVLSSDPRIADRFAHRWLSPHPTVLGLGILSAHPLEELTETPTMMARVDLGASGSLALVNGHPMPGKLRGTTGIPLGFDGTERDAAIEAIRERVDTFVATGDRVVVIGDYNVTPTEAGYRRLTEGLRDAHAEAGNGAGGTWRPRRMAWTGIGLIRIDYVLSSPDVEPVATELRCDVPGDHCLLLATLAFR